MTQYKAIFSDMDGTVLTRQHQISPRTLQAIQSLYQQLQIPFILVSARPPRAMIPYADQLNNQQCIICYSGALILDKELNSIYSLPLDTTDFIQLEQFLAHYSSSISINYYYQFSWLTNDVSNAWVKQEQQITGLQAEYKKDALSQVHKVLLMAEPEVINELAQQLSHRFPQLAIHRSKPCYLEIMHPKATKAQAIAFILKQLKIKPQQIIAFGDNFNDKDMLQYAGLSVAMGNAPNEIKQICRRVTEDNDNDGIALVLEDIFNLSYQG
ncbi:Cof-type HAD-IIB family hydrolase [Volucribacter amazonae]|uniref:Hydrolase n=1 Tax=Volucribacter amazonae TaxID=256731 RepID=A0A9X4PBG8_9PAST|nr:Cof-type HAD-IIB family hydrolase [Volucribacter amazonae]MDG6896075.1 hydrolase [Volucribacter amazonae]